MRTHSLTTVSNVLLLMICLCISAFVSQDTCTVQEVKSKSTKASFEAPDVLNPIYIFK